MNRPLTFTSGTTATEALETIRGLKHAAGVLGEEQVAVFDLDDTLIPGDLDQAFLRFATSKTALRARP